MYLFQIFVNRVLTPAQGQEMLDRMFEKVTPESITGGFTAVKIPGVNTHENPFPVWVQDALKQIPDITYDDINFCYQRNFPSREKAKLMMDWFDATLRPWLRDKAVNSYPESVPVVDCLHVRVMDHSDGTGDADTF
jgi:hypothetical protein